MVKPIYVDILFLINFIINYLILFTVGHIGAARLRRLRIAAGALVGAVYGVVVFFPAVPFITSFPVKIAMSLLMVLCAFGRTDILKNMLLFLAVSLAFGGVVFAAALLGLGNFCEVRSGVYYIHISLPALLISSFAAYILLSLIFRRSAARADRKLSRVTICANGRELSFCALHDTGNSLRDPATNAPVVISDYSTLRDILPEAVRGELDIASSESFPLVLDKLTEYGEFKLIPYKTVGVKFSLMLAYRPEKITLDGKVLDGALVAISPHSVSDGGAYAALI